MAIFYMPVRYLYSYYIYASANVEMFALYILSRFSHIRENMYNVTISFAMQYRVSNIKTQI